MNNRAFIEKMKKNTWVHNNKTRKQEKKRSIKSKLELEHPQCEYKSPSLNQVINWNQAQIRRSYRVCSSGILWLVQQLKLQNKKKPIA